MKVRRIDGHVLPVPDAAATCSSAQDDLVVEVHNDEGLVGIGETDTHPWVARECIRARGTHGMARVPDHVTRPGVAATHARSPGTGRAFVTS
jgi:hypothetical protein